MAGARPHANPLVLTRLSARGFRNLRDLALSPGARFNVIHGDNGQGKSNLLEAIDYLASLRSFRGANAGEMIQQGAERADLLASLEGGGVPHEFRVSLSRHAPRSVKLDGKRPRNKAAYFTSIQMVLFHPGDMQLVVGPPELRRVYLDRILEQFDATYASTLDAYQRALRSRNRLLRGDPPDKRAVTAYDELLASAGAIVGQSRARLIEALEPAVKDAFSGIAGEEARLDIAYGPRVEPEVAALREALARSLDKDLARGFTAEGPHADELLLALDANAAKRYGSQGQHRAIVLALKVAELHELTRRVGKVPILLLDDVSSELDKGRNRRLFTLLSSLGGQVFLTTTHPEFILVESDRRDFRVRGGELEGQ